MKKFITVLLTFTLYFNLISNANASSNLGGWSMGNPVAQGASAVYTGTKNVIINGADYIKKGTAKVTPNAAQVAKVLRGGAAGYALSIAVEQLLGAVDWVLDPANNQIVYTEPSEPQGLWAIDGVHYIYTSGTDASRAKCAEKGQTYYSYDHSRKYAICKRANDTLDQWSLAYQYAPPAEAEEKYLPLPTVAQQVISNAASGDTHAQAATTAAAADIINEAQNDQTKARPIVQQLESTAQTTPKDETAADNAGTATGESTANPETGATDLKLEFPVFCNWAPSVCEAAQVVISFPHTLTNWWETATTQVRDWATAITETWTKVKEWVLTEPEPETENPELPEPEQPEIDTEISFDGQCPADREASVNMGVGVIKLPISYEPICTTVSTAKPVLIFVGFFLAALIIGGVKSE